MAPKLNKVKAAAGISGYLVANFLFKMTDFFRRGYRLFVLFFVTLPTRSFININQSLKS